MTCAEEKIAFCGDDPNDYGVRDVVRNAKFLPWVEFTDVMDYLCMLLDSTGRPEIV